MHGNDGYTILYSWTWIDIFILCLQNFASNILSLYVYTSVYYDILVYKYQTNMYTNVLHIELLKVKNLTITHPASTIYRFPLHICLSVLYK